MGDSVSKNSDSEMQQQNLQNKQRSIGALSGPSSDYLMSTESKPENISSEPDVNDNVHNTSASREISKPAGKKHNTRARNGIVVQRTEFYSPGLKDPDDEEEDEDEAAVEVDDSVDACALALASLDDRANARAQISDANRLLEALLMPMSLPWAHPDEPVFKMIPRDIDEMPGILSVSDDEEVRRSNNVSQTTQVTSRRSSDPGIVELIEMSGREDPNQDLTCKSDYYDAREQNPFLLGELSLRMYQQARVKKRQRQTTDFSRKKTRLISFRVGSTSSRSTIFDSMTDEDYTPLFLPAILPRSIQDGTRRSGIPAHEAATQLGTLNCRPIPPLQSVKEDPSSRNRFWVGRTRLIWSEKEKPGSVAQRAPYRSVLTGARLESNSLKRPLHLKVAVRVDDKVICAAKTDLVDFHDDWYNELIAKNITEGTTLYSDKILEKAFDKIEEASKVETEEENPNPNVTTHFCQCSLKPEIFFSDDSFDKDESEENAADFAAMVENPFALQRKISTRGSNFSKANGVNSVYLKIDPPKLTCLATEEGFVGVTCTRPGSIQWEYEEPEKPEKQANINYSVRMIGEMAKESGRCCSCWSALMRNGSVTRCSRCQIAVHTSCIPGQYDRCGGWVCSYCSKTINNDVSVCLICKQHGGQLVQYPEGYMHEICRIWSNAECFLDPQRNTISNAIQGTCHICGNQSGMLVGCAAEHCNVLFHPMCAIIMSVAFELHQNGEAKLHGTSDERDAYLCTQYSLSMLHTACQPDRLLTKQGRDSTEKTDSDMTKILPIAFCGYHNPKRQVDYYGLPPVAYPINKAIRIPPKRKQE